MESSKLTDEELIEIASACENTEEFEVWDLRYYQQNFNLKNGKYKLSATHLYYHYKNWSINPVEFDQFIDIINIDKKNKKDLYIDRNLTSINITKLIGEYVAEQKKTEKEKRFREISSTKSKTKR